MPFLEKSQGTTVNGGNFHDAYVNVTNYTHENGKGIKLLLRSSLPQAIHNSNARNPPKCHPGTREEYIRNITSWGLGRWKARSARALWMRGPAGVGKSALAQICAQNLYASGQLGATFFFYRPNGWNDSDKFIPTIAYQLTTRYPAYRDLMDTIILHDPLVLEKSIDIQFDELLVKPFRKLNANGQGVGTDIVIIIDGLDECDSMAAQGAIIELVITSVDQQTTPFFWAFFSRSEPHITSAFSTELAVRVSWQLELPVSRGADKDIEAYLRDSFKMIHARYGLPARTTRPSEDDIRLLIKQSSGLFIYPATIIRYIEQDNASLGLEGRLRLVLKLNEGPVGSNGHPLSALDQFYMLIMEQIPKADLLNTLSLFTIHLNWEDHILSSRDQHHPLILYYCSVLGLSLTAFHMAISNLHSVLNVHKSQSGMPLDFSFYHKSFIDFLSTSTRSGPEYCINTPECLQNCFKAIINFLCRISNTNNASILAWPDIDTDVDNVCQAALRNFFALGSREGIEMTEEILQLLSQINWRQLIVSITYVPTARVKTFNANVPPNWRSRIIHPPGAPDTARWTLSYIKWGLCMGCKPEQVDYVIGTGSNRALLVQGPRGYHVLCRTES